MGCVTGGCYLRLLPELSPETKQMGEFVRFTHCDTISQFCPGVKKKIPIFTDFICIYCTKNCPGTHACSALPVPGQFHF